MAAKTEDSELPSAMLVRELGALGVKASEASVVTLATDGLGAGLPAVVPALFDRNNQKLASVKAIVEEFRLAPERRKGTAHAQTLAAFIALVERHADHDSAIFCDMNGRAPRFQAVLDYHRRGEGENGHEPRWLGHRIAYTFPLSEPWQAWLEMSGEPMKQAEFAMFMEDRIADLAAPTPAEASDLEYKFQTRIADPAEVMGLSRGMQVAVNSVVKHVQTLQSGEAEITYVEEHRDAAGNKLLVPGLFMLSVPVFFGGEPARIPVRLRYRKSGTDIIWFYQMWRPEEYVTGAVVKARDAVFVETGLPVYEGAPEGDEAPKPVGAKKPSDVARAR